jgi:hypothetical protein
MSSDYRPRLCSAEFRGFGCRVCSLGFTLSNLGFQVQALGVRI